MASHLTPSTVTALIQPVGVPPAPKPVSAAVQLGIDHPTDPIGAYSAILANHAGRTLDHLNTKLSQRRDAYRQQSLGDGARLGEQL